MTFPLTIGQEHSEATLTGRPHIVSASYRAFRVEGQLDVAAFLAAIQNLANSHGALRARIVRDNGRPKQLLMPPPAPEGVVSCQQIANATEAQFDSYVAKSLRADIANPHDSHDYPFRFRLLRYSPSLHAVTLVVRKAFADGPSMRQLARELWLGYESCQDGRTARAAASAADDAALSYREAAIRERNNVERLAEGSRAFWTDRLVSMPLGFDIGMEGHPASELTHRVRRYDGKALTRIKQTTQRRRCSISQYLLAAFAESALSFTSQASIAVQVPFDLRENNYRETVGMFTTSLPVVIRRRANMAELIDDVRHSVLRTSRYARVPAKLLEAVSGQASYSRTASSNIAANLVTRRLAAPQVNGLMVVPDHYAPALRVYGSALTLRGITYLDANCVDAEFFINPASVEPEAVVARFETAMANIDATQ